MKQTRNTVSGFSKVVHLLRSSLRDWKFVVGMVVFMNVLLPFLEMMNLVVVYPFIRLFVDSDSSVVVESKAMSFLVSFFGGTPDSIEDMRVFLGVLLIVLIVVRGALLFIVRTQVTRLNMKFVAALRSHLFEMFMSMPYLQTEPRASTDFMHTLTGDMGRLQSAMQNFFGMLSQLMIMGGICVGFALVNVKILFFVGALSLVSFLIYKFTRRSSEKHGRILSVTGNEALKNMNQSVWGFSITKIHGVENYFINKHHDSLNKNISSQIQLQKILIFPRVIIETLFPITAIAIMLYYASAQASGATLVASLGVLVFAAFRIMPFFGGMINAFSSMRNARFSIARIHKMFLEFADEPPPQDSPVREVQPFRKEVAIRDLSFSYGPTPVLAGLDITIRRGEFIGIIGRSGAGKSTFINILIGLYKPQEGDLRVDGVSILECAPQWRQNIGYVPQNIFLLDDTIRRNVAFGCFDEHIDEDALQNATEWANLSDFIESLPEGFDTNIGENGIRLSGGQRQRLGIARALYRNPELLIFDEATNALDHDTEQEVMATIRRIGLSHKKTVVSIAHMEKAIRQCDVIYRLESGVLRKEEGLSHTKRLFRS